MTFPLNDGSCSKELRQAAKQEIKNGKKEMLELLQAGLQEEQAKSSDASSRIFDCFMSTAEQMDNLLVSASAQASDYPVSYLENCLC